ncbi:MAG: UDP-3-O-acyl-N-acetylglucosamine deacetylase [Candidatus Aminicenantes bacterium]|jgi:UDP-3-O-[3-hydroxymyristoyl] N-acetylglucosamine deacetylase
MQRKTLEKEVVLKGVGVHSGHYIHLILAPSAAGRIEFVRKDLGHLRQILDPRKIIANYSTELKGAESSIQTLEHLLAVLFVFGIDSINVELDGGEIPILDGSAKPIVDAVQKGGIRELKEKKKSIQILESFQIRDNGAAIDVSPDPGFRITYVIEYEHPAVGRQEIQLNINLDVFINEIAPARTFGFLKDVPALRSRGLTLGGSLDNAVVLDENKVINGPLRFPDEFVRHKVLDFIGDLSLLGSSVSGHFKAQKAGHSLHHKIVLFLLDHPEYWTKA